MTLSLSPRTILRFAPSPTGFLHLGHAYSAYLNKEAARLSGGLFRLRIEDIDFTRCTVSYRAAIIEDLGWLSLLPDDMANAPPLQQSLRRPIYREKINWIAQNGLAYPCFCTRSQMVATKDGRYGGTCRPLTPGERARKIADGTPYALRLNQQAVHTALPKWHDGKNHDLDDIIIARKDIGLAYVVAVVVDDAAEGINHVIRGEDLRAEAIYQEQLHALFGTKAPRVYHHSLILDEDGGRLAKSKGSESLRDLRAKGHSAAEIGAFLEKTAIESGDLEGIAAFVGAKP